MRILNSLYSLLILSSLASAQTVLTLTGDEANTSSPAFGSSITDTLDDPFAYDPVDPTSSFPDLIFSTSNPDGYHSDEPNNGDVTLTYTLDHTIAANELQVVVDLWGREGGSNAVIDSRDDDFDVELFSGETSLGKQVNQGIGAEHHTRVDFGKLPVGTLITRLVITARHTQSNTDASAPNRFTLMEIRAAIFTETLVTILADELDTPSGSDISLREAIRDSVDGDTIIFDPSLNGGLIQLDASLGQLVIAKSLTIDASALPDGIIIDGGSNGDFVRDTGENRCLFISDGVAGTLQNVTLVDLTLQNGVSGELNEEDGGNIFSDENLTLRRCRILDGRALDTTTSNRGNGGGITHITGTLTLQDCTVARNLAEGSGGGIVALGESLLLTNCTVAENTSQNNSPGVGGILSSADFARITRCTITGNSAEVGGGITFGDGENVIEHCTIVGNTATRSSSGAGVANGGGSDSLEIAHSIIRDNLGGGPDLGDVDAGGLSENISYTGSNLIGTLDDRLPSTPLNTAPILLAPLANYGGPTETMPPLVTSPVIDAATTSETTEDQRGFPAVGTPDIGAAEFQGEFREFELAFSTDGDGDGLSVGIEFFIGTDPFVTDFENPNRPKHEIINGAPTLTFGVGNPPFFSELIIERSTTLSPNSFERVVLLFSRSNSPPTQNNVPNGERILNVEIEADKVTTTDETGAARAFYRLGAIIGQPCS